MQTHFLLDAVHVVLTDAGDLNDLAGKQLGIDGLHLGGQLRFAHFSVLANA